MEPEEKNKSKLKKPIWLGVIGALAAGAVFATTTGLEREGVRVQEYSQLAPKAYCTVLVYMDGSDLESDFGAAADDLKEMEQIFENPGVAKDTLNIVVEAGGSSDWQYEAMRGKEYGRFCISSDGVQKPEEMEARNMGSSDTLADFINYGIQSYPAEHYGLVMWNHGAGQIEGFGSDSNFDSASMPLESIKEGIESSEMKSEFDFFSLDACLMGNMELVSVLQGKTKYLIASEELEPQDGYDYAYLKAVFGARRDPSVELGQRVGEAMLLAYDKSYRDKKYKLTLCLVNMEMYDGFHRVFHQVIESAARQADEQFYRKLGELRKELQGFGISQEGTGAEIVDVMDLLEALARIQKDETAAREAEQLLRQMIPKCVVNGYMENSPCGLSIYLPDGSDEWLAGDMAVYERMSFCDSYQKFIQGYKEYLMKEYDLEWSEPARKKDEIRMEVDPDQIDEITAAYLTTFRVSGDGVSYLLSTDSDVKINRKGSLRATPEDTYWGLGGQTLCLIETVNTDQYTEYRSPVLYNGELCMVYLGFDEDNPDGIIQTIAPAGVTKQQYEIREGDEIVPLYPLVDAVEGNENVYDNSYYMGKKIQIGNLERGDALLEQIAVDTDTCSFGFLIQDTRQQLYYTGTAK